MAMEYEFSVLIAGGTASGKTSMLNAVMPFMPANQRIISIEDTRELNLPDYLHWLPMTTRPPNPEGDGGIGMLDLLQNSLRMRPDRIIVGEVRAKREAEVLFEAMHTGHSVYGTFHAERAQEVVDRITSPPMDIPGTVMKSLHLIVIQYRNRRTGNRRTFEICEVIKDESEQPTLNTLYKWEPRSDSINKMYPSIRIKDELAMFTGMGEKEVEENLSDKKLVLDWMLANKIEDVNSVGRVVTEYYMNKDRVVEMARKKTPIKGGV
jgi:archaeal flagellar protein FlaI